MSPWKASTPCRRRGCPNVVSDGSGYCSLHKPKAWDRPNKNYKRMGGRKLQTINKLFMRDNPLCVECLKHGIHTLATVRDHIIPLAEGGEDTTENSQALCKQCHDKKTREEARRGMKG